MNKIIHGEVLDKLEKLSEESVHCVITSPPYPGVDNMWGELFHSDNFEKAHDFLERVWIECIRVLKPGCKLIINIANTKRRPYLPNVSEIYSRLKYLIEPVGEIIWHKGYGQTGTAWGSFCMPSDPALSDQHEYILVFRKYGKRERPKEFKKIPMKDFTSWRNAIWKIPPAKATRVKHIAPFPKEIPKRLVILYTFENEIVLDPFVGSGTTCVVAKELGRQYIGIDHKEEYVKLSNKNLEQTSIGDF